MKKVMTLFFSAVLGTGLMFTDNQILSAQETDEEFTLDEILVTAQKREENQQKVPISMEVISGENLAAEAKTNVDEILSNVSNVLINTMPDGMRVSIRGLVDQGGIIDGGTKTSSPSVAVNVDGAYNNMASAGQNLFDVERVEVLMGPQSTLYSSNSPGGIVNIVTTAPKTDRYSANGSVEYGSFHSRNLQAALNVPVLRDRLAMRLALSDSKQGTWVSGAQPSKTWATRLKTMWNAADDLSMTLTGNISRSSSGGMMGGSVKPFVNQDDDTYPDGTTMTDPWTTSGSDYAGAGNRADQLTKGGNLEISWGTPIGALTVIPSYSRSTSEGWQTGSVGGGGAPPGGGPPPMGYLAMGFTPQQAAEEEYVTSFYKVRNTQKGAELRMASSEDFTLFTWIAGWTYYKSEFTNSTDYFGAATNAYSSVGQTKKALYANISYPLRFFPKFSLNVGYRQSWDNSSHSSTGGPGGGDSTAMDYSKPDMKYGFQYDMDEDMMIYGSYATSYRTDAMAMSSDRGTRPPEKLKSYTIGAKSRMLNNKLQVNASAFYYDYRDYYMNDGMKQGTYAASLVGEDNIEKYELTPYTVDGVVQTDENGEVLYMIQDPNFNGWGDMRSKGADVSTSWIITSRDMLNLSVSYLNSKWYDLIFDYRYDNIWPDRDYDGVTAPNAPKLSISASYDHHFTIGGFGTLTPHVEIQHKSKFNLVLDTGPLETGEDDPGYYYQEAYNLYNASVAFSHSSGTWSVNAIVKNATNYASKRAYQKGMGTFLMLGEPRTYSATLSVRF